MMIFVGLGVLGVLLIAVVIAAAVSGTSKRSSSSAPVPQQYLTPLLCDVRENDALCGQRETIAKVCNVGVLRDYQPETRSGPRGGASFVWKRQGQVEAIVDYLPDTITVRTADCTVEITRADYERANDPALGQDDLPVIFGG